MNRNLLTMALLICGLSVNGQKKIDYVDPLIGTNGMGHTFPGACVPHGFVHLSPDTDTIPHNKRNLSTAGIRVLCRLSAPG